MKTKRVFLLMVLSAVICAHSYGQVMGRQNVDQYPITAWGTPTYGLTYLPSDYNSTTTSYPLIIFLHGSGEGGDGIPGLNNLLIYGLPNRIANGWDPQAVNPADGKNYKFIVVSPQAPSAAHWSYAWGSVQWVLADVMKRYRIDPTRIYVTGISAGGAGTWSCVTNGLPAAQKFAAIVPVSAAGTNSTAESDQLPLVGGTYGSKVWSVAGASDAWLSFATSATNTINNATPAPAVKALLTAVPGGHDPGAWNAPYDPNWRNNTQNLSIYEWMLSYTRPLTTLTANAGSNQTITLPTNQVTLNGSGTPADGNTITGYAWTMVSGPSSPAIVSPATASTQINGLIQGSYVFRLTVTDNLNATASSDVTVTVNPAPNTPPVANAGPDQSITLPVNTITLNGSGTDADGTIASYSWAKTSGPTTFNLINATSAVATVNNLVAGVYTFELTVTDNRGAIAKDAATITVNPAPNVLPKANAGPDQTITLPVSGVTLSGAATDTDGTIASSIWTKISGPTQYSIATPAQLQTNVTGLVQGAYQFELKVTDNSGGAAKDTVIVTVNAAPNTPPTVNAGPDQGITLPTDSVNITATGTDADGTITSYQWLKISGPSSYVITAATQAQTTIKNLVQGVYQFEVTVTDNNGATAKDTIQVTVAAAVILNAPPSVNAGADTSVRLPIDTAVLSGSAFDSDGSITSYKWRRISGPLQFSIDDSTTAITTVRNLLAGIYGFTLTVTDDDGAVSSDTVYITVNTAINVLPVSFAGADTTIELPQASMMLNGRGADVDGTITNYLWRQVGGPSAAIISTPDRAQTWIDSLSVGVYQFELTVTDNDGATAVDTVQVTVNPHINIPPVVNAGADTIITLPANSVTLNATANDPDGSLLRFSWSKVSGPIQYLIASPDSARTDIRNLAAGLYQFEVMVTDSAGAVARDTVNITVNPNAATTTCNGVKRYMVPGGDGGRYYSGADPASVWYTPFNPGDTLVLKAQYSWSYFSIDSYSGTAACPIVIINEGGQVWMTSGIETRNVHHIKITGSGDGNSFYGFRMFNPMSDGSGVAVSVQGKSNCVEIERVDAYKKTYGVWAKQDPLCDVSFNYPNYVMDSIEIHHSRFKNIGQDCIYAGNTDPTGQRDVPCGGVIQHYIPMRLSNINIHHLIIDSCNRTGIQLSGADDGYNQIHDNIITGCGYEYNQQQGTGISIGGMTKNCHVYNNTIKNTFLYGILSFGAGVNYIENNSIDSTGWLNGVPNLVSRPCNILVSPKTAIPFDSTTIIIRKNRLGRNVTTDSTNLALVTWGPDSWTINNVICGNTNLNGTLPALEYVAPGITYIKDCSVALPSMPPTAYAGNNIIMPLPIVDTMLKGSGSDPDGYIISYHWTMVSGPAPCTIASPDSAHTVISNLVQGVYSFRLTVMDNDSLTATDDIEVSVAPPNVAPIANAGANQIIYLPTNAVTMTGSGLDPDGTIASYQWTKVSGPASSTIGNAANPSTQITNLVQGVYLFELKVTDNMGAQDVDTIKITVNPAPPVTNIKPVARAGADQTITLPTNFVTVNGSGTDADGTVTAYLWTKLSGPTNYSIASPAQAQSMITNLAQGRYEFVLQVTDNQGAVGKDTIVITVNAAINVPPVANAGPDKSITLPVNTVTLQGSGNDADGLIASYQWTKISGPATFTIVSPNQVQTVVNNLVQGVYQFELKVTDNLGAIGKDTVNVIVNAAANIPPIANAGPDQAITLPLNAVTVNGSGTDIDGTIKSYLWTKISGPQSHTVVSKYQGQTIINDLVQGVYQFELTVTDNNGATGKDTVTITVNAAPANIPPVAYAGRDTTIVQPSSTATLNGSGTDEDGTVTAYLWTKIAGPAAFNIVNPAAAQTPVQNLVPGVYQFELRVTDNKGATAKDTMTVTVFAAQTPTNIPPVAHAGADQVITLPTNSVTLNGIGADADGTVIGYTWTKISGPSQYGISAPTQALTVVNNLVKGVYRFELKVTDNQGAVGRDTMTVTVNGEPVRVVSTALLYPNPATTVINIKIDAITHRNQTDLRIYDSKGGLVYEEEFLRTTQVMVKQVDISKLEKGIYFVVVNVDINNELTLKFVKE